MQPNENPPQPQTSGLLGPLLAEGALGLGEEVEV